jgi:PadR family transcriptional regulator PadR
VPLHPQTDALRGSLDLLVLKTLSLAPMHGWGIGQRVQQISEGVLEVNQGSLYPALQRLEKEGLITSDWDTTDNNRRARYYRLTASGRRALIEELKSWRRFAAGLESVLKWSTP